MGVYIHSMTLEVMSGKDDGLLAICGTRESRSNLFERFKGLARPFKLKFVISSKQATFLDLTVKKVAGRSHPVICPYFKPSSMGIPLHHDSYHLRSVHERWPLSRVRFFEQVSTLRKDFVVAACVLYWRIADGSPGHPALNGMKKYILSNSGDGKCNSLKNRPKTWFRLKFHRVWIAAEFRNVFEQVAERHSHSLCQTEKDLLNVGIAWQLADRHHGDVVCTRIRNGE